MILKRRFVFFGSYLASAFVHGLYDFFLGINLPAFSLIISAASLFLTGPMLLLLIEKSPYKNYKLHEAKEAIPALKRGLYSIRTVIFLTEGLQFFIFILVIIRDLLPI